MCLTKSKQQWGQCNAMESLHRSGHHRKAPAPPALAARQEIVRLYVPQKQKHTEMLTGGAAEVAKQLVKKLREDARVLS